MKIKTSKIIVTVSVYWLVMSVLVASVHAKDLVTYSKLSFIGGVAAITLTDVGSKALSGLHNHVDNMSHFNHFMQSIHHQRLMREREEDQLETVRRNRSLVEVMLEKLRLIRFATQLKLKARPARG